MLSYLTSLLAACASMSHIVAVCFIAYAMPAGATDGTSHQPLNNARTNYDAALFMQYDINVLLIVLCASVLSLAALVVIAHLRKPIKEEEV